MRSRRVFAASVAVVVACTVPAAMQSATFQFVVSATDASGAPVTDLELRDVLMTENGEPQKVARVEPLSVPIKLTIAVDNGSESAEALIHYRSGLTALVESLPVDVEVAIISTAPQPRTVVPSTTDRVRIVRGINGFAPEQARPRFSDALVEYSQRLEREARDRNMKPYAPVLLMLSTSAPEQQSYQPSEIGKAMEFLVARRARLNVVIMSTRTGQATSPETLNASLQAIIAMPVVKATNGRYESLAVSSRLTTLLPEWGKDLAALHARQAKQFRVTVERTRGGELRDPRIELARPGLTGAVTLDGYLP